MDSEDQRVFLAAAVISAIVGRHTRNFLHVDLLARVA